MSTRPVYYHETIDVTSIREKEVEYLRVLGKVVTELVNTPKSDMRNYAKWVLIWATGRWPAVIGQWEMRSWDWFAQHFESFSLEVDHPEGYEQYRSGGFDRLLVPHEGTPSLDEVVANGVRAPYVLQETITTEVGKSRFYLDALSRAAPKIAEDGNGVHLHGAYNVMLRNDSEVLVQWAVDSVQTFTGTMAGPERFPALDAWRREAAGIEWSHTGVLLKPTSWSALR
jgi:hypothetical protein